MTGPSALPVIDLPLVLGVVLAVVGAVLVARQRVADPLNEDSDSIPAISAAITSVHRIVLGMTLEGERTIDLSPFRGGLRVIENAQAPGLAFPATAATPEATP